VAYAAWPEYDPALAAIATVTMVIQIDGKVRDRVEVAADITEDEARALALASEKVQAQLAGAAPVRIVVRPPALVNVVTR
jgi:leucyl-tRNA synthetase